MEPTDLHQTIAYQIDNQRPPHLEPGRHVGMAVIDADTLLVLVGPTATMAIVRYDHGRDTYLVTVNRSGGEVKDFDDVYCDMLGDLIFGVDASPATFPMGGILTFDDDGTPRYQEF